MIKNKKAQSAFEYMMIVSILILFTGIILYAFNVYSTHAELQSQIYKAKQSVDSLKNAADFAYLYAPSKSSSFIYLPPSTGNLIISNKTILIRLNYYSSYTDVFSITEGNLKVLFRNCTPDKKDVNPCGTGCDCGGKSYRVCVKSNENGTVDLRFGISCGITADAGDNKLVCTNESTAFDGSYSYSDAKIISYEWNFGDGKNATGVFVNHTYENASTYTAALKITDETKATDSTKISVQSKPVNENPKANFTFPSNATVCQIMTFDASSSYDPDGTISSYYWSFSDGINASGKTFLRPPFASPGNYIAELTVYDNGGCGGVKNESISKSVNIKNIPPTVRITSPANNDVLGCNPVNIIGTAQDSCNGNVTKVNIRVDILWNTANGTVNWIYNWTTQTNGNHTICANATDNDGGTSTECINVSVSGCLPNLIPVAGTFTPKNASVDSTVNLCINITNTGIENATGVFTVTFISLNESGNCSGKKCYDKNVAGLNTSEVKQVCYNITTPGTPGNYTFLTAVDYFNNITESNEEDNNYTGIINIKVETCSIVLVNNSVWQDQPVFVRFKINNTGSNSQTIDKMNVTWDLSGAKIDRIDIDSDNVWSSSGNISGTLIDITNTQINSKEVKEVKLRFSKNMKDANITVTFILDSSAICSKIYLTAPGANEICGNCIDEDGDGLPDWADPNCSAFFRASGCGEVHYCDPKDDDDCRGDCGWCNSPLPPEIDDNSTSICSYYGYSTAEWHFYRIIPDFNGKLTVNFSGNASVGSYPTDLDLYDASCNRLNQIIGSNEAKTGMTYNVTAGNTYIIALDVDVCISGGCSAGNCTCGYTHPDYIACNCSKVGTYNLTTTLDKCKEKTLDYSWREGWKNYSITTNNGSPCSASNPCNCTGPSDWKTLGFNDSSWGDLTLPMACAGDPGRCNYCDFFFRKKINIPGTPKSVIYKFASDDGMWLWVNNIFVVHDGGDCHGSGCAGGLCCNPAENDPTWKNITSYFTSGENIVAVHTSEQEIYENFDMIFNITYIPYTC